MQKITCEKELALFDEWLVKKGRKHSTIRTYKEAIRSITEALNAIGFTGCILDATEDEIQLIKSTMNIKESSKKLYMIAYGKLLECFGRKNIVKDAGLLWNAEEKRRIFIKRGDYKKMLDTCDERETLVLMLGGHMGLRRSEICKIRLSDIEGDVLKVYGKGHGEGKVVFMKIPEPVQKALDAYMKVRVKTTSDKLIVYPSGHYKGQGMSGNSVANMVKRIGNRCGVTLTPHSLRRLFATTLYDCGVDLNIIRDLMRHESIDTTISCYIQVNPELKKKAVNAMCNLYDE